ncbi:MAG TPA: hypothetical protein VJA21_09230 [Verrucomicrobiae bacterium]
MKTTSLVLLATGAVLMGGCASPTKAPLAGQPQAPIEDSTRRPAGSAGAGSGPVAGAGYDDRQIAQIRRGETLEPELLQWFGSPESRAVQPDGRSNLSWALSPGTDGGSGASGVLRVVLGPDGKVEAYAAHSDSASESRTEEFVEKSEADLREHMEQWRRGGWTVHSVSARLPQADGTVHRKAELSRRRSGAASDAIYDDQRIADIRRGETVEARLLEWFGPPRVREMKSDGQAQLAWSFAGRTGGEARPAGRLEVSLRVDGTVDSYAARSPAH